MASVIVTDGVARELSAAEEQAWRESLLPDLDALKAAKKNEVDVERERRVLQGYDFMGKLIQLDPDSRANINAAHSLAKDCWSGLAVWPADFAWRAMDNEFLPLPTPELMIAMGQTGLAVYNALLKAGWAHKDAIAGLATADAVLNYDITVGWPG